MPFCHEWYAAITVELKPHLPAAEKVQPLQRPVGVDSGLTNYLYLSDGTHIDNPRFLNKHQRRIRKAQRRLSRKRRVKKHTPLRIGEDKTVSVWSSNGLRAKVLLAKRWQKYTDVKNDWQWKRANQLTAKYDFIAYENLPIRNMLKNHNLARAIQDASWAGFWPRDYNSSNIILADGLDASGLRVAQPIGMDVPEYTRRSGAADADADIK